MTEADSGVLSIGIVAGGVRVDLAWNQAVKDLARQVAELRAGETSVLRLNVVYCIPGEVVSLNFEGVRTGRYSSKIMLLLVQATIPTGPPTAAGAMVFLLNQLDAAINLADEFAQRRALVGRLERLDALHRLARRVRDSLTSRPIQPSPVDDGYQQGDDDRPA